jgi:hypothetical protein
MTLILKKQKSQVTLPKATPPQKRSCETQAQEHKTKATNLLNGLFKQPKKNSTPWN